MKLTVGMAHFNDFYNARTTVLGILSNNIWLKDSLEVIVVDNSPENSEDSRELLKFCNGFGMSSLVPVRYVRDDGPPSSYRPRDRIFSEASGEFVVVMDCHVDLGPGTLNRFAKWAGENPDCRHLLSGPLIRDAGAAFMQWPEMPRGMFSTHYGHRMRSEMWGTWEADPRGQNLDAESFQIPGNGLGLFACRRAAWPGFNPNFRGFGGGEKYLHDKFVLSGAGTLCLPFMRWLHRFQHIGPRPHLLNRFARIRNSVLGALEHGQSLELYYSHWVDLGAGMTDQELRDHLLYEHSKDLKDLDKLPRQQLDAVHKEFKIPKADWDYLIADPINHTIQFAPQSFAGGKSMPLPSSPMVTADYIPWLEQNGRREMKGALPHLRDFGDKVHRVTEFTSKRDSSIAFMASAAKEILIHTTEPDNLLQRVKLSAGSKRIDLRLGVSSMDLDGIPETELLYLDSTPHSSERLRRELNVFSQYASRFIVIRGARQFGRWAEGHHRDDNFPGILKPLKDFLAPGSTWFVVWNSTEADLSVLGRNEADRPAIQQHIWPPGYGPGSRMKKILASVGIKASEGCGCKAFADDMDTWGVDGCTARFDLIVETMKLNAAKWGWSGLGSLLKRADEGEELSLIKKWLVAGKSFVTGLAFKLNPLDPFPGLVRMAIESDETDFGK